MVLSFFAILDGMVDAGGGMVLGVYVESGKVCSFDGAIVATTISNNIKRQHMSDVAKKSNLADDDVRSKQTKQFDDDVSKR